MIDQLLDYFMLRVSRPIRRVFAGWVACWLTLCALYSQPDNLYFHHLTPSQGLSQSTSGCIYRDSRGFVWIGSADGLNRFDGVRIKVYTTGAGQLADPTICGQILEDPRGDLWFCTLTTLHHYRRQSDDFDHIPLPNDHGIPLKDFHAFHLDRQERLWIYGKGQLHWFDIQPNSSAPSRFHPILSLDGYSFCFSERDSITGSGTLYARGIAGVIRYHYQADSLTLLDTLAISKAKDVFQDKNEVVWAGNAQGIWCLKAGVLLPPIHTFDGQPVGEVRQIQPYGEQYLWAATNSGLYLMDKYTLQFIRHWEFDQRDPASLSMNNLSRLYIDPDQNMWLATWTKGIDYTNLNKLKFQTHRYYTGSQAGKSTLFMPGPLVEDHHQHIWCGSQNHGLLALEPDQQHYEDFSALVPEPEQIFTLEDDNFLVNNFKQGLSLLNPKKKIAQQLYWKNTPVTTYHLCQISSKEFLLAQKEQLGLVKLAIQGTHYAFEPLLSKEVSLKEWLYIVRLRSHEFLLIDANYAVYYYRELPNPLLRSLTVLPGYFTSFLDSGTSVWLSGSFGILQVNKEDQQCRYITLKEGLPTNMVYAMLQAGPDDYWLSTGQGLIRFHPSNMQFQSFTSADGLQAVEFNRASSLRTSDGTLWFGGIGGYNYFRPENIRPLQILPKIQIVDIQINDLPYPYGDNPTERYSLRLPYDSSTLTFHFAALEFSDPANNRLKYQLKFSNGAPFDQDWIDCPDAKGFARYAKLPPGQYKLEIMAANSDGIWNPVPKEFFIEITPPFYQTWWFRCLMILAGAAALYAIYRARLINMRKKEEQKRKVIELELNALRAQLNPHFISNNLIAINSFIRNNGVEKVRGYVATFARLMRNVLESARNPVVPLAEELQMLHNYVEVESGRFPQPIDFTVQVAAGLEVSQVFLPGMLLQPFIENAIAHGLAPRNGQGKITVQVSKEENALVFIIEDDGVGRGKTITPAAVPERKSYGLDITRERLQWYDLQHHTTSTLHTEDLKKEEGVSAGTRVTLRLGLLKA